MKESKYSEAQIATAVYFGEGGIWGQGDHPQPGKRDQDFFEKNSRIAVPISLPVLVPVLNLS